MNRRSFLKFSLLGFCIATLKKSKIKKLYCVSSCLPSCLPMSLKNPQPKRYNIYLPITKK